MTNKKQLTEKEAKFFKHIAVKEFGRLLDMLIKKDMDIELVKTADIMFRAKDVEILKSLCGN